MTNNLNRRKEDKKIDDLIEVVGELLIAVSKIETHIEYAQKEISKNCNDICKLDSAINGNGKPGLKIVVSKMQETIKSLEDKIKAFMKNNYDKKQSLYNSFLKFVFGGATLAAGYILKSIVTRT